MKPKTKLQFEVLDLHKYLEKPTKHEPFIIAKHDFYFTTHYKNLVCLECNHSWKPNSLWQEEVLGVTCPSCQKGLKKTSTERGQESRFVTYSITEVFQRFQVVRYFSCWKHMDKKKPPRYNFRNLFEEWKDWDKDKKVIIGRTQGQGYYSDGFSWADYELRANPTKKWGGYYSNIYDRFVSDYNIPNAEILPRFDKYQLTSYEHDYDYRLLIDRMKDSPRTETLFKANEKGLLSYLLYKANTHNNYWPQIKIAMRNKYKITDAGIWYDYLSMLSFFKKDLNSPKYVCPENLHKEHNRLMEKKRVIDDAKRAIELAERAIRDREHQERARLEKAEKDKMRKNPNLYVERNKKFLDLEFKKGKISIKLLQSVAEFKEEGKELKHCVHTNEYFLDKDSLVFSAKVDGKKTETIEVKISTLTIIQSRGYDNKPSKHNGEILDLMGRSLKKIQNIIEGKPKRISNRISKKKVIGIAS